MYRSHATKWKKMWNICRTWSSNLTRAYRCKAYIGINTSFPRNHSRAIHMCRYAYVCMHCIFFHISMYATIIVMHFIHRPNHQSNCNPLLDIGLHQCVQFCPLPILYHPFPPTPYSYMRIIHWKYLKIMVVLMVKQIKSIYECYATAAANEYS